MMFRKVLVGVDGRPGGRDAIALATLLAPEPARFLLATVFGEGGFGPSRAGSSVAAERMKAADLLDREREGAGIDAQMIVCHHGAPGRALRGVAEQKAADLLVVGSCHRGVVGRTLLGDDTLEALNGASCAVAVAPRWFAVGSHQVKTIGVGHDGSMESGLALDAARALAEVNGAQIRVLAVPLAPVGVGGETSLDSTGEAQRVIATERERLAALGEVKPTVSYGDPHEELVAFASEVDLMIVGSRSRGPAGRLLYGDAATHLARHATCPVLVLPRSLIDSAALWSDAPSRDLREPVARAI